uniref:Putative leucine-rich repeat protein (LRRP) n=1 Tax=Trypanosoma congolense (strain IL3000) TaxID=1068625 RepID=G0UWH2_TRYCI|nr:putative leucine-rich repeat protein (LRRP) [Trypanosoma congolense IL3000]
MDESQQVSNEILTSCECSATGEEIVQVPLTGHTMRASLSSLSSNADGCLVYAQSRLASLGLTSIDLLSSYEHLQRLSLDNNKLVSLKPLRALHSLVYLSAAGNALSDDVFDDIASSSVTMEKLNLDRNDITTLKGLSKLPFLMDFSAEQNSITELEAESFHTLHSLTRLNVKHNKISNVHLDTFSDCSTVRTLNLSHNSITNTEFVIHLAGNLESLNMDHNGVRGFANFDVLHSLVFLFLSNNNILQWDDLDGLSSLENLRVLTLDGNPLLKPDGETTAENTLSHCREPHPQQDVDFAACRIANANAREREAAHCADSRAHLSSFTAPQVRSLIYHLPAAPQANVRWECNGSHELAQLPYSERCRFRVISTLPQLRMFNSTEIHAHEIPRAMRLYQKDMNCFAGSADSVKFPVGSALKAVELHRVREENKYMR